MKFSEFKKKKDAPPERLETETLAPEPVKPPAAAKAPAPVEEKPAPLPEKVKTPPEPEIPEEKNLPTRRLFSQVSPARAADISATPSPAIEAPMPLPVPKPLPVKREIPKQLPPIKRPEFLKPMAAPSPQPQAIERPRPAEPAPFPPVSRPLAAPRPSFKLPSKPIPSMSLRPAIQPAHAQNIYGKAISLAKEFVRGTRHPEPDKELERLMLDIIGCHQSGDYSLLALACKSTASNYLYAHSANTAILSLHTGVGLGWGVSELIALGATGFLHDLMKKSDPGSSPELEEISTHVIGEEGLGSHLHRVQETETAVRAKILGATDEDYGENMSRAAQIVCVCDLYEAMSHPRDWREPIVPHEALKRLIRVSLPGVENRTVKFFLERMSLFPPGSYVLLSTGDVGVVVGVHPHLPTRPVVSIKLRGDGSKETASSILDLEEKPILHVAKAVDETTVAARDKKVLLQFQANRWWTEQA